MAATFELSPNLQSRHLQPDSNGSIDPGDQRSSKIEPIQEPELPEGRYPKSIGRKFTPSGELLPFPGNTVICHLPLKTELWFALQDLYKDLQDQDFASLFAFLPPSSWHMTVYEGVSDQVRKRDCWPGEVPVDSSLADCNAYVEKKLASFDLGSKPPFRIAVDGFEPLHAGIALKVVPATVQQEQDLRGLRDRLADHLQMRHPGHKTYSFHVSMAYTLRFLEKDDSDKIRKYLNEWRGRLPKEFELGAPEFCVFEDMFAFHRRFFLENRQ